jgi:prepilin-type N-terminal cleavage/methylation domain-containing protein
MRSRGERGLTMVEMLVALALLGFVLLGIVPLFMGSVQANYAGNEYTSIHNLCRDRLEQLMNLPFNDPQLSAGAHNTSDLPPVLPDPLTGIPPASGGVVNPFALTYQVRQFQTPNIDPSAGPVVANGAAFTPTEITTAGQIFQYKRIDVTVVSNSGIIGIGARVARIAGFIENPSPALNLSVVPAP